MDDAGGSFDFEGITTTDAFCDRATMLKASVTIAAATAAIMTFF